MPPMTEEERAQSTTARNLNPAQRYFNNEMSRDEVLDLLEDQRDFIARCRAGKRVRQPWEKNPYSSVFFPVKPEGPCNKGHSEWVRATKSGWKCLPCQEARAAARLAPRAEKGSVL